ncbi:hypothetical protein SCP_0110540 [Sparassis crispa]|uniref:MYND-type domain-containing protein n=1 Tax=Sparassis crispa TaxID=139825 RepID=A0A401G7M8_9APHY|nr:hypothetical protein SCP_0110540 [Sparassis crispa]GBE78171.1 hypothetical protein SCP_0110540 [Sparassis crispa]
MPRPNFPGNFVLDLHDLAAIILSCHAQTEDRFANAQLVEINCGDTPLLTLPSHVLPLEWHYHVNASQKRVAYIVRTNSEAPERTTLDTFVALEGVRASGNCTLSRRELEDVFWRCKDFDSGYVLAYVAQSVIEALPASASIRARTSSGFELICSPSDVVIGEIRVRPHEACLMVDYEPRPDLGPSKVNMTQHLSGFDSGLSWIYLLLGKAVAADLEVDTRVVLDLVLPQIGGRGGGGELFALERGIDYHQKVLPKYASEFEGLKMSEKLMLSPPDIQRRGDALTNMVLAQLGKVIGGQDGFCRYCGEDGVETRCSKCKKAYFCKECQVLGWKYHKVWCT